jgi:hypothetical protein
MARTFLFADGTRLYSIDRTVGYNPDAGFGLGANRVDDVMLVQFLLRQIFSQFGGNAPLGSALVVDGTFGPATHYWIYFFQHLASLLYNTVPVSGYLDSVFGPLGHSQVDKDGGMYQLNQWFTIAVVGKPLLYGGKSLDITADPSVPALLQSALRKNVNEVAASISPR